jgi:acyl-CoA synthetase (NDP forming)
MSKPLARDLVEVAETTDKPICVIWGSPVTEGEKAYEILLSSSKVVTFRTFANCIGAVKAYIEYHEFAARYRSPFRTRTRPKPVEFGEGEHASKELLAAYGIPITREEVVTSAAAAIKAASAIGYPVVMKAEGVDHKSDENLVRLGIASPKDARSAYAELSARTGRVLVAEQIEGGVECVIGVSHDELFGPVVMFGLGGVFVEVFEDVSFRVPPFDKAEARRMIDEVRGSVLLKGARGRPKGDLNALVDTIMKVQKLAVDNAETLAELDINPLVVLPKGVVALDALAVAR